PPESSEGRASFFQAMPTLSSRVSALASASAFFSPITLTGASMMFSITVMLGNRLKCWKTMPMSVVVRRRRLSGIRTRLPPCCSYCRGVPPMWMYPPVSSSSVITRRRMVVLPEPEGPIRVTRSPWLTVKFRSSSTVWSPNLLTTSRNSMWGVPDAPGLSVVSGEVPLQSSEQEGGGVARGQEGQPGERDRLGVAEGVAGVRLGVPHHLRDVDDHEERGLLEHGDRVVAQRRQGVADRLRHDHGPPGAGPGQGDRKRGLPLALGHRGDAWAVHCGCGGRG